MVYQGAPNADVPLGVATQGCLKKHFGLHHTMVFSLALGCMTISFSYTCLWAGLVASPRVICRTYKACLVCLHLTLFIYFSRGLACAICCFLHRDEGSRLSRACPDVRGRFCGFRVICFSLSGEPFTTTNSITYEC